MVTTLVNRHKERGTVYIGRGSRFGNPFSHLPNTKARWVVESREVAVQKFEEWARNSDDSQAKYLRDSLWMLHGERLECFCAPLACHGNVLIAMVEEWARENKVNG